MDREWVTRCVAKPLELSRMKLANDLATRVPADLGLSDQRRLLVGTFLATGLAVAVVHAFLPGSGRLLGEVIVHALVLATTYTVCVLVVGGLLFLLVQRAKLEVEAWHLWVVSFLAYNLGYFLDVPLGENSRFALHPDAGPESPLVSLRSARPDLDSHHLSLHSEPTHVGRLKKSSRSYSGSTMS